MSFSSNFQEQLISQIYAIYPEYKTKTEHVEYSGGDYKVKFDGYLEKKDQIIIIECEFRRADPVNNLLKIIYWLYKTKCRKNVKLIQIFWKEEYEKQCNKTKKEFAIFLGKRCYALNRKLDIFEYVPLEISVDKRAYKSGSIGEARILAKNYIASIKRYLD